MGELLVLHAAVDGDAGLVALRANATTDTLCLCPDWKPEVDTYLKAKADGGYHTEHGGPGADPEEQASLEASSTHTHATVPQCH